MSKVQACHWMSAWHQAANFKKVIKMIRVLNLPLDKNQIRNSKRFILRKMFPRCKLKGKVGET